MVRTIRGHKLTRVPIVLVPSLLSRIQSTRVGVALRLQIKDRVDRRATVTDSGHDRILVRTHNVGDAV